MRKHDPEKSLAFGKTENLRCLILTPRDRFYPSTVYFREVSGIVDDEGNNDRDKTVIRYTKKIVWRKINEYELENERGPAHHQKIPVHKGADRLVMRHSAESDGQGKGKRKQQGGEKKTSIETSDP